MRRERTELVRGDRFALIVDLLGPDAGSVLDVGCRGKELGAHLPGRRYVGMDLFPPADVIADAEERFPFEEDSFDAVVFADVLEHLDNPHDALEEGMRVARRAVIILLPNMFSLVHRLNFARGHMSGKYRFGSERLVDRHRWLMDFDESDEFARGMAERNSWWLTRRCAYAGAWRRPTAKTAYRVARAVGSPNLWAWEYAARLEPRV